MPEVKWFFCFTNTLADVFSETFGITINHIIILASKNSGASTLERLNSVTYLIS